MAGGLCGRSKPLTATQGTMPMNDNSPITNGARDVSCFECRNSIHRDGGVPREGGGFHHQFSCRKGLPMPSSQKGVSDGEIVAQCPGGEPQVGFQIGGYYSHMWFEPSGTCLNWLICSDGEFPTEQPEMQFHICDFRQLERFVEFWGKELRRRGVIEKD
jgi:hypothetical protein